jgi:hypothetical protein
MPRMQLGVGGRTCFAARTNVENVARRVQRQRRQRRQRRGSGQMGGEASAATTRCFPCGFVCD